MNVFVTGANGFIGSALCGRLASDNNVIGVDITGGPPDWALNIDWEQADLTDGDSVTAICAKYSPDVVIHCAGIAHQQIGAIDLATYMQVNSEATENLAKAAYKSNPAGHFIFFSSVSVYGEKNLTIPVSEGSKCQPSSDYAFSKLEAEKRLKALYDEGKIHNLTILRLAPVYDHKWSYNLDRRVIAPFNIAYIKYGSGQQKMSALARPNLVDFIKFLIENKLAADTPQYDSSYLRGRHGHMGRRKGKNTGVDILNVCDEKAYKFSDIIQVLKNSGTRPNRPVISMPLPFVWLTTHLSGILFAKKRKWFHSCYEKLASNLVFDNKKMLNTGFVNRHSLQTVFSPARKLKN
jgi:nucleoside-diphosphate-sugar epimerase